MIKLYAYYNHGGYKDFYLGSLEESMEAKYFLPLLQIHEQELTRHPDNELLRSQVERQKGLPKLVYLSDATGSYNYPYQARMLMSHAGYKVLYKKIDYRSYALAVRDIEGPKDVYGRLTPFNIMLTGDEQGDVDALDRIAESIRKDLAGFEKLASSLFVNDILENGLRCELGPFRRKLNDWVEHGNPLRKYCERNSSVRLLVVPNGASLNMALKEQHIERNDINVCCSLNGIPLFTASQREETDHPFTNRSANLPAKERVNHPNGDIEKLWEYVRKLEERIVSLENSRRL